MKPKTKSLTLTALLSTVLFLLLCGPAPVPALSPVLQGLDTITATATGAAVSTAVSQIPTGQSQPQGQPTPGSLEVWTGWVTADAVPYLNVRTSPWGTIVDSYKPGRQVKVVDKSGEWLVIDAGGLKYVYARYITRTKPQEPVAPAPQPWTGFVTNEATPHLNVRSGPWGTITGSLKPGEAVKVLRQEGEWLVIDGNRFVYAKYVSKTRPAAPEPKPWTGYVNTDALNVRTAPWGSKVDLYRSGQAVTVIGKEGDWYKISAGGKTLFVHADYISASKPASTGGGSTGSVGQGWGGRPVAGGWISSNFGYRKDPFGSGATKFHSGVDYAVGGGTPVKSLGPGKVTFAGWNDGYGNLVKVQHDNGYVSYYAHLKSFDVGVGARVGQNSVLGKVNTTGSSTGNHLHFELRKNGQAVNPASVPGVVL